MANIGYIQEQMRKFEENKKNENGVLHLQNVLEGITETLEEPISEKDKLFVHNVLDKCRNMVLEKIKEASRKGVPIVEELFPILYLMKSFSEYGFDIGKDIEAAFGKLCKLF